MTWISKSTTFIGTVLLAHACYSAIEHSTLQSATSHLVHTSTTSSPLGNTSLPLGPTTTPTSLPLDISLETLLSIAILSLGLALGTPPLRPIQWRVWAGQIEREGESRFADAEGEVSRDYVGNPFKMLETRPAFVDIRRQRGEFAAWVRNGGKPQVSS